MFAIKTVTDGKLFAGLKRTAEGTEAMFISVEDIVTYQSVAVFICEQQAQKVQDYLENAGFWVKIITLQFGE